MGGGHQMNVQRLAGAALDCDVWLRSFLEQGSATSLYSRAPGGAVSVAGVFVSPPAPPFQKTVKHEGDFFSKTSSTPAAVGNSFLVYRSSLCKKEIS